MLCDLPAPISLPMPDGVRDELEMLLLYLADEEHGIPTLFGFRSRLAVHWAESGKRIRPADQPPRSMEEWIAQNGALARRALAGDDHALLQLILRDVRYLGEPLATAKMLGWQMEALIGSRQHLRWKNKSDEDNEPTRTVDRSQLATMKLDAVAAAVAGVGPGRKTWRGLRQIHRAHREINESLEEVRDWLKGEREAGREPSTEAIAARLGLDHGLFHHEIGTFATNPDEVDHAAVAIVARACKGDSQVQEISTETVQDDLRASRRLIKDDEWED
ncbi:MAG TPA: hypothetical protein VFF06_17385 [Polyangia bacterium]|nr:hypothetical protein [Polyangia bacterium]